jgi:hypothetical protein
VPVSPDDGRDSTDAIPESPDDVREPWDVVSLRGHDVRASRDDGSSLRSDVPEDLAVVPGFSHAVSELRAVVQIPSAVVREIGDVVPRDRDHVR